MMDAKDQAKHFDAEAKLYDAEMLRPMIQLANKMTFEGINFKGKYVLDIGCGTGWNHQLMKDCNYTGIDISEEMVKIAKAKKIGRIIKGNANDIKLNQKFDIIVLASVLHHTGLKPLSEAKRLLKNDGIIIINDLLLGNKESYYLLYNWFGLKPSKLKPKENPFDVEITTKELDDEIKRLGLKVKYEKIFYRKVLPFVGFNSNLETLKASLAFEDFIGNKRQGIRCIMILKKRGKK